MARKRAVKLSPERRAELVVILDSLRAAVRAVASFTGSDAASRLTLAADLVATASECEKVAAVASVVPPRKRKPRKRHDEVDAEAPVDFAPVR